MKHLITFLFCLMISLSYSQQIPTEYTGIWAATDEACATLQMGVEPEGILMVHDDDIAMDNWYIEVETIEMADGILTIKGKGRDSGEPIEKEVTLMMREGHLIMNEVGFQRCNP